MLPEMVMSSDQRNCWLDLTSCTQLDQSAAFRLVVVQGSHVITDGVAPWTICQSDDWWLLCLCQGIIYSHLFQQARLHTCCHRHLHGQVLQATKYVLCYMYKYSVIIYSDSNKIRNRNRLTRQVGFSHQLGYLHGWIHLKVGYASVQVPRLQQQQDLAEICFINRPRLPHLHLHLLLNRHLP